ncbi:MAG: cobalamin-binding protein [Proteobacteria bacterium]|nr:cobalamin-binding protein [Pseudomonadota bacterium]
MTRTAPRILSLLPSATEIAVAVGRGEALVGRSHECDFPPFVAGLPVCTATKLEKGLTSRQIEDRVQEIVRQGLSVYEVKAALVRELKPDVVLTQSQCAVCAVTPADLEAALRQWVGEPPVMLSLAPDDLSDVWSDLIRVGEAVDAGAQAVAAVERLREALAQIRARGAARGWRPRVAAIEWIEPLMAAGNWVPELIEAAGGEALFAAPGQHSPWLDWETLAAADPDAIVLMPCGYGIARTLSEMASLHARPGWRDLAAVRAGRVFAVDGHHYFNRPGPRLVQSAEILAEILDRCADPAAARGDESRWRIAPVG